MEAILLIIVGLLLCVLNSHAVARSWKKQIMIEDLLLLALDLCYALFTVNFLGNHP